MFFLLDDSEEEEQKIPFESPNHLNKFRIDRGNWFMEFDWLRQEKQKRCVKCSYCNQYVPYDYRNLMLHQQSEFHKNSLIQQVDGGSKKTELKKNYVLLKSTQLMQYCCICKEKINSLRTDKSKDIFVAKTMESQRLIVDILEQIIGEELLLNRNKIYCVCDKCLLTLNEYDEACQQMTRTEEILLKFLEKPSYFSTKNDSRQTNISSADKCIEDNSLEARTTNTLTEESSNATNANDLNKKDCNTLTNSNDDDSDKSYIEENVILQKLQDVCDLCGKIYTNKNSFYCHKLSHTVTYECSICNAKYKTKRVYRSHMAEHEGLIMHQCRFCSKKCTTNSNLKKHLLTHSDEKPHKCNICEIRFKDISALKRHLESHTDIRLFQCHICGKSYKNKKYLVRHIRRHKAKISTVVHSK